MKPLDNTMRLIAGVVAFGMLLYLVIGIPLSILIGVFA